ncbi:MAG TPA: iron uptake transporter permease EfeU [Actinomycetota bacterium]|nr:iron uptake transporter permease EfeU [Actinomycetota bacterium]
MGSAFVLMLREGLEAALIVAIVLAYLKRLGRDEAFRSVWLGTGAAVLISVAVGGGIFALLGELEGKAEAITEGVIAFSATAVLTWMIFWMARQARFIKGELQAKVDAAVAAGSAIGLAGIAFVSVLREGLESALFLVSTTVGDRSSFGGLMGALLGIAGAAGIGYLVYRGSRKVNLRVFFRVTGVLIILFAAGLLAKGIHEFQEVGFLATAGEHLWDVGRIALLNPDRSMLGEFLHGLFGWSPDPSFEMVLLYALYLVPIGTLFLVQTRKMPALKKAPAEAQVHTA